MAVSKDTQDNKPVKISKWDGSACKNAIDDAVKAVIVLKFDYEECFRLIDGRLIICSIAVGVALFALLWDHLYPFPQSRPILIFCVSTYFILMGVLTLYTTYKEKGIFVVAVNKSSSKQSGHLWEASSFMTKFDDKYQLSLTLQDSKTGKRTEASVTRSVGNFIDDEGVVVNHTLETEVVRLHNTLLSKSQ